MKKYIYIMQSEDGMVKIGISKDTQSRRSQVQCGSGHILEVISTYGPFHRARELEGNIHKRLADSRKSGEWFACGIDMAVDAVNLEINQFQDSEIPPRHTEEERKAMQDAVLKKLGITTHLPDLDKHFLQEYLNLGDAYCAMEKEYGEAIELADWYKDELVKVLALSHTAVARIKVLEAELSALLNEAQPSLQLRVAA